MFTLFGNLFTRHKVMPWEIDFLKSVFSKLQGSENSLLYDQIVEGVIGGVCIGLSSIPNTVVFRFTPIVDKYENRKCKSFDLNNIKVRDVITNKELLDSIFIADGLVAGYTINTHAKIKKYTFDANTVDVSFVYKSFCENGYYEKVALLLTEEELNWIAPDIYPTELNGKIYYHIRELEDGDFLGIDTENCIYKITHDPYDVAFLERGKATRVS